MMYYYPYDARIHNLGNIGLTGKLHAEIAPLATKIIDLQAYNGRNVREEFINGINPEYKVLDICCGVGISTSEYGIDTSPEMINKAKRKYPNKKFLVENAEKMDKSSNLNFFWDIDVITCMFGFHEMPEYAHNKIINNCLLLAKKEIFIIDISPEYKSSKMMLSGEPYLLDYQKSIEKTMDKYNFIRFDYIPTHVTVWKYLQ